MLHYLRTSQVLIVGIALFSFGDVEAADVFNQNEGFRVAVPNTIHHGSVGKHVKYQNQLVRPQIEGIKPPTTESMEETLLPPYYTTDTLFGDKYKPWGAAKLPSNPPN